MFRGQMSEPETNSQLASDPSYRGAAGSFRPLVTETPIVAARQLTKRYGEQTAVDGIDFTVSAGETFGLLGPNGAGKSTTMRMIACRAPLTSGELSIESLDVRTQGRKIRSLIGVVPQDNNLDPDFNVRRNLIVSASYFRIPK